MKKLICLGDSLTFGLRVPQSQTWPRLVGETGVEVVALGICGDTTGGMLARLPGLLREQGRTQAVLLIMGGSNDIFYSGTDTAARCNIGAMVHQAIAAGLTPVVGIPIPIVPEDAPKQWEPVANFHQSAKLLENYCAWLKTYCKAFGVPTVDFRADFLDAQGVPRRELYCDGLHPNAQGHRLMARRICDLGETL